jgi:RimJ/RimL family protein N-acetyltransferase
MIAQVKPLFEFRTIELPHDSEICVRFWRDAYACSFDDPDKYRTLTDDEYLTWLAVLAADFPQCCVNVQIGGEVIGQLIMNPRSRKPAGYVNLFYLVPEMRGSGAGDTLHKYVALIATSLGIQKLQLNVTPSNERALRYYLKHGWVDLGPQPGHAEVHLMELAV